MIFLKIQQKLSLQNNLLHDTIKPQYLVTLHSFSKLYSLWYIVDSLVSSPRFCRHVKQWLGCAEYMDVRRW